MRSGLFSVILLGLFYSTIGVSVPDAATSFPDPLPLSGPFFFVHDPSMVQRHSDGRYFLFTTHDKAGILTAEQLAG